MRVSLLGSEEHNPFTDGGKELFDCAAQGRIDAFFLFGGQIDGRGNINLIGLGEQVTWSARHLGWRWRLTSRIVAFDRPRHFRDAMVEGVFTRFDHDHWFHQDGAGTHAIDVFDYTSPLGVLGRLADALVVRRHLQRFLAERMRVIRALAESDAWRRFVPADGR